VTTPGSRTPFTGSPGVDRNRANDHHGDAAVYGPSSATALFAAAGDDEERCGRTSVPEG
jgi:hypothetical protein